MNTTRYPWVDFLKTLGIVLVVAGHTHLPSEQHRWIYSFHMPLFFLISGFLLSPGAFSVSLREFVSKRIRKLLALYFGFGILAMIYYCYAFRDTKSLGMSLQERIVSLLYASGSTNQSADLYPVVLWYFPGLICALLLVYGSWQIPSKIGKFFALGSIVVLGTMMAELALPWELESGCIAAGWIAIGHTLRLRQWDLATVPAPVPVGLVAVLIGSTLALFNSSPPDIRLASLGNPWLSVPAALLIIVGFFLLCKNLPSFRLITAISAATILIFPTHTMAFPYVDRIALKIPSIHHAVVSNASWYLWLKTGLVVALTVLLHAAYQMLQAYRKKQHASKSKH
jgi:acyltransferase